MKLILIKDVINLGKEKDVVEVKPGYARNFLIPQNLAKVATEADIIKIEKEQKNKKLAEEKKNSEKKSLADQFQDKTIEFTKRATSKNESDPDSVGVSGQILSEGTPLSGVYLPEYDQITDTSPPRSGYSAKRNKIFGSVTSSDITKELAKKFNLKVKAKDIILPKPIKDIGEHKAMIKLAKDITAEIKVVVKSK